MTAAEENTAILQDEAPKFRRPDRQIWGIYIALALISLIELYSASSREVTDGHVLAPLFRHAALLGLGCMIMLGLQRVHYRVFYRYTWLIVLAAVAATIWTMLFGTVVNGAQRSFTLLFITVQPSELLKFAAALVIARVLGDGQTKEHGRPDVTNRALIIVAVTVLVFSIMLVRQGLTNTLLLMAISLTLMVIAGVSWRKMGIVLLAYGALGGGYYLISHSGGESDGDSIDRTETRENRITNFLRDNKYADPITSENQQEQYSYIAQANGGLFGVGPGNSRETARLPLAFSDYIYAIVVEDTGFVGGVLVLALYLLLLARAGRIASQCKKAFPALLVIGMAIFIVYQALFHIAIVTGVFPVSGQPLPFISKGGSSVIISSVALGMMLSVSRFADRKGQKPTAADSADTDRDMADNPTQL